MFWLLSQSGIWIRKFSTGVPLRHAIDRDPLGELAADIRQNKLLQPIVLYQGQILDGRNRYLACGLADVEPEYTEYEGDDPLGYVLSLNLHRRHLTASQRAALAAEIANLDLGRPEKNSAILQSLSRSEAAEKLDVSARYVNEAKKIQRESPEHFDQVKSGELSLQQAKRELRPKPDIPLRRREGVLLLSPQCVLFRQVCHLEKLAADVLQFLDVGLGLTLYRCQAGIRPLSHQFTESPNILSGRPVATVRQLFQTAAAKPLYRFAECDVSLFYGLLNPELTVGLDGQH